MLIDMTKSVVKSTNILLTLKENNKDKDITIKKSTMSNMHTRDHRHDIKLKCKN